MLNENQLMHQLFFYSNTDISISIEISILVSR